MTLSAGIPAGPFTWAQARSAGMSRERLTDLLAEGKVRRVVHGVYQPASLEDTIESRCAALALVMRPFGVVCDRTASWLHGVDTFDYRELDILPPLDAFVLRDHSRTRRSSCRGGRRDLSPRDICFAGSVPVTTPLRTALDLGCSLSRRDALAALDGFMRICGVTLEGMKAELPRYRGRRGVVQLRRLVPLATPLAESPGESWTRMAIIDAGLPAPQPQIWVTDRGRDRFRLDLGYERARVAVEYDGREFHDDPARRLADRQRRDWLRGRGWTVIVVRSTSFTHDALAAWLGELAAALWAA